MAQRPTDPEDATPGSEVGLTRDQYEQLVRFVPRLHTGIRLRDLGAAYVRAELIDPEGQVSNAMLLHPQEPRPISRRALDRLLRKQDALDAQQPEVPP